MIVTMLESEESERSLLVIVLNKRNIERMMLADPVTLDSVKRGGALTPPTYSKFSLLIACEEDEQTLIELVQTKGTRALLQHLQRGYVFEEGVDGNDQIIRVPRNGKTDA